MHLKLDHIPVTRVYVFKLIIQTNWFHLTTLSLSVGALEWVWGCHNYYVHVCVQEHACEWKSGATSMLVFMFSLYVAHVFRPYSFSYVFMYTSTRVCIYICIGKKVFPGNQGGFPVIRMYIYIYIYLEAFSGNPRVFRWSGSFSGDSTCIHICIYTYTHICLYTCLHIRTHMYVYIIFIYIHPYMQISISVYIYVIITNRGVPVGNGRAACLELPKDSQLDPVNFAAVNI